MNHRCSQRLNRHEWKIIWSSKNSWTRMVPSRLLQSRLLRSQKQLQCTMARRINLWLMEWVVATALAAPLLQIIRILTVTAHPSLAKWKFQLTCAANTPHVRSRRSTSSASTRKQSPQTSSTCDVSLTYHDSRTSKIRRREVITWTIRTSSGSNGQETLRHRLTRQKRPASEIKSLIWPFKTYRLRPSESARTSWTKRRRSCDDASTLRIARIRPVTRGIRVRALTWIL